MRARRERSNRPGAQTWNEFFELIESVEDTPATFMAERPMNMLPQQHRIFDDELSPNKEAGR